MKPLNSDFSSKCVSINRVIISCISLSRKFGFTAAPKHRYPRILSHSFFPSLSRSFLVWILIKNVALFLVFSISVHAIKGVRFQFAVYVSIFLDRNIEILCRKRTLPARDLQLKSWTMVETIKKERCFVVHVLVEIELKWFMNNCVFLTNVLGFFLKICTILCGHKVWNTYCYNEVHHTDTHIYWP